MNPTGTEPADARRRDVEREPWTAPPSVRLDREGLDRLDGAAGPSFKAEIAAMDTPRLRGELARALQVTAEGLAYLAAVWRELERRGEDLSDLRTGLAAYLPRIADGTLDPEAVVRFAGQRTVLARIAGLPLDEQRRLARGGTLPIVVAGRPGPVVREVPAAALTAAQARIAIADGRLRPPREQRRLLAASVPAAGAAPAEEAPPIRLRSRDHQALLRRAAAAGVPVQDLVRDALARAGLLD